MEYNNQLIKSAKIKSVKLAHAVDLLKQRSIEKAAFFGRNRRRQAAYGGGPISNAVVARYPVAARRAAAGRPILRPGVRAAFGQAQAANRAGMSQNPAYMQRSPAGSASAPAGIAPMAEPSTPAPTAQPAPMAQPAPQQPNIRPTKELRQFFGPSNGVKFNRRNGTYNFNEGDWSAYQNERERLDRGWSQLNDAEKAKFQPVYDKHMQALDRWSAGQADTDKYTIDGEPGGPRIADLRDDNPGLTGQDMWLNEQIANSIPDYRAADPYADGNGNPAVREKMYYPRAN